jgi:NAD(P)H-nitrite reductase large subunit
MKYVIIGNSAAAIATVEGIRSVDKIGEIILISKESQHTYSRPLISYLLQGKTDMQKMKYRPDSFYADNKVETLLSTEVKNICTDSRKVVTAEGKEIPYDYLLVSTGSRPFVPPTEGLDCVPNKYTFASLDDALALDGALSPDKQVLIVGAGLIGLKCAEGIKEKVKSITVLDMSDRVLSSILDERGSEIVKNHLEKSGINLMLSDSVKRYENNIAYLASGKEIKFDVLVTAIGVRPNTSLLSDIGAVVNRGIVVDNRCRTSIPNIYSAGDCTECFDISADATRVLALLPNAYLQGYTAGRNMAGEHEEFDKAIPMNSISIFGLHIITAGSYNGENYINEKDGYKRLITRDDKLVGFILIGNVDRAGIYTALVRNKTPLKGIDFELIKDRPALMAFTKRDRQEKLGGIKNEN